MATQISLWEGDNCGVYISLLIITLGKGTQLELDTLGAIIITVILFDQAVV